MFERLFQAPYSEKIQRVLPVLFNIVELENKRGDRLGMEVGTARERVLIALFMYAFGNEAVAFPPSTSPGVDVLVNETPVSIKTKTGSGDAGVKLVWTVDWDKVDAFARDFRPAAHLLFVQINWKTQAGGFYLISHETQNDVLQEIGRAAYLKLPARSTNPRGVELAGPAMRRLKADPATLMLPLTWRRDASLLTERALYGRWIDLWDSL